MTTEEEQRATGVDKEGKEGAHGGRYIMDPQLVWKPSKATGVWLQDMVTRSVLGHQEVLLWKL